MKQHYSKILILLILFLILPLVAMAAADFGLDAANPGLGETGVKDIITSIIRIALGFLGIIAVGFILYAGFVWMTAGGSAEKIDKAKKILIRAAIGLVIILSSYAIASFVIRSIGDATGASDGSGSTTGPGGGFGGNEANLVVNNWQPYDGASGTARNILVRVYFNKIIDASTVASSDFSFVQTSDNTPVNFNVDVVGSRIDIQPLVACDVEGADYCLGDTVNYEVAVAVGSITSTDDKDLICTTGCSTSFTTSDFIDVTPPEVSLINPQDNDTFSVAAFVDIEGQATDDSGMVSGMMFTADNEEVVPEGIDGAEPWIGLFSLASYNEGDNIDLGATAEDLSGNLGTANEVDIMVLPAHCFNQVQDEDETGVDCGGSCGGCLGDSCDANSSTDSCEASDTLCGQGVCNLECICALAPVINNVSPDNGAEGNYITITGDGFGSSTGSITFLGTTSVGDEVIADIADCAVAWSPWQVIVEVPVGAISGGIRLNTSSGDFDTTLDERGWQGDFIVNETIRPGICGIAPESGTALSNITINGTQFGADVDRVIVGGVDVTGASINSWNNTNIVSLIPNLQPGKVSVAVGVGDEFSNPVQFEVVSDVLVPSISYLEPDNGPMGTYITIHGDNFGFSTGDVLVSFINGDSTIAADIDFPAMCGDYSVDNNEIVVKVPDGVDLGLWNVLVSRDQKDSLPAGFNVTADVLSPGLCLLQPDNGPVGTIVDAYGEGFGSSGQLNFFQNIVATILSWTSGHINTQVPVEAGTGSVSITSGSGGVSNALNFAVGSCSANTCSPGEECCSDGICRATGECVQTIGADEYIWSFTTGQQLPPFIVQDVWPVCEDACINTMIGVEFSNPVDLASLTNTAIDVKQCTDSNCTAYSGEVDYTAGDVVVGYYDETNYILSINPAGNLATDTYYRVVLKSGSLGIVNEEGGYLENVNYASTGGEVDSYSWIFKTGVDICTLDSVEVLPDGYEINSQETRLNMTGYAYSEPDSCSPRGQMLDPVDFTWTWQSTNSATATVAGTQYEAVVTPVWGHPAETSIVATADGVSDDAQVIVNMDIPRIDSISPDNGMINENLKTYVTVYGANFGDEQGSTIVLVGGIEATIADCNGAWSNTQIVVEMPLSTTTGNTVKIIKTGGDDESDPFTVNSIIRPALCSINPSYGTEDTRVTLTGYNFGDEQNDSTVFFDQLGVNQVDSWSNTKIKTRVPYGVATGPVTVNVLGNDSNSVVFSLEPYIDKLNPDNGSVNSYMTIHGGNFGDTQGDGYVLVGGQRASQAPCIGSWQNTSIKVQIPEGLSLGNAAVQVITNYGVGSNEVNFDVNEQPANSLLCEINPSWAAVNERVELLGDKFGDAPYLADLQNIDTKQGAAFDSIQNRGCIVNNGSYVGACSGLWVEYNFNFSQTGYYNAWAETENYSMDLTDQGIYQHVNVYLDGVYMGYFSNPASNPDHQVGSVGLGWIEAGTHIVHYRWTNDWCGGCNDGVGDSNIRFHNVGIDTGSPMSYALFTSAHQVSPESWSNTVIPVYIDNDVQSGPVSVVNEVVVGQECAGFHIGSWCPGNEYVDVTASVESNSVDFNKGCVIGTTSAREEGYIPTVAANSEAVGVLATDGKYLYGKSWGGYDEGDNIISIIGSGYQDTVLGQDYGNLASVNSSLTMTYHSDGFLYNAISNADQLQKIDVESGGFESITIPTGLMERSTGSLGAGGWKLITSDGQYIYNLAYGHDGGAYNGFKVRVYNPAENWSLVREWISGNDSFYTDGIIADGRYIYAFQWSGAHKVRMMDVVTGEFVAEWVSEQGKGGSDGSGNDIISGQYDWVNDRVWMGDLVDHSRYPGPAYIYKYNSCNSYLVGAPPNCGDGVLQINEGEQCDAIVKEDGEIASDWDVYDGSPPGQYSVVYDEELQRNVIQLQTDGGTATGFRLGNTGPSGDAWNYSGPNWDIQWRMKTFGGYRVYISTQTTLGHRYITYPGGHGGNNYVPIETPAIYTDGNWHYVYRDLQADLETEEPGNQILEVNGFLIRGNTRVVDIAIGADLNDQQCSDLGDYNAGIIACDVATCQLAANDCALGVGYCGDGAIQWPNVNNEYEMCDGAASLPSPVAHWAMDGDSWTVGSAGDVVDSGGSNNGEVMQDGIQTVDGGQNGKAGQFTATGNIAVPMSSSLEIQNNLTMSAWVKPNSRNIDDEDIIILGQGAYYLAIGNDGALRTYWYGKSNPGYHSSAANAVPLNEWSHIAAVWDNSSGQVKLFVNGQLVYTVNSSGAGNVAINQVWLGGEYSEPNQQRLYDGLMDEVKIWDVALSAQEINAEYLGSTQNCTNECTLPSICGNEVIEYGEDCDDGNQLDGDGCSSVCIVENESSLSDSINYEVGWQNWSNHNWVHVDFRNSYVDPVLILSPVKHRGGHTSTFRIKSLSSTGFDFRLQESNTYDDPHCCDKEVYYFVTEAGNYMLPDGSLLEAKNYNLSAVAPQYQSIDYQVDFANTPTIDYQVDFANTPIVLSQVISSTDGNSPSFQPKGTINYIKTRQNNVSQIGFEVALETDTTYDSHVPEMISWLAISSGTGNLNNELFEAKLSPLEIANSTSYISFDNNFSQPTFFASSTTVNDPAPGVLRWINLQSNAVDMRFENDDGSSHSIPEKVNYLVINLPENVDPPAPDICGNGEIEADETCDSCPDDVGECSDIDTCGNGVVDAGETCDDGNTSAGDGCSIYCQTEIITGGSCGDGIVQWPNEVFRFEQCDDGNTASGDGCSSICYLESGHYYGNCPDCDSEIIDSQIVWWPMDDNQGAIVSSSINNLNDGALVNGDNSWVVGLVGDSAVQFNGDDTYVTAADPNADFDVSEFTVSAWVNLDEFYQEYSIATLKYQGDWNNHSQFNNTISGIDDYINIGARHNFGHLNADGEYYDTVAKIPDEIYDFDIIIWDHNTIDLDLFRLDRNKPVYLVVRGNRYGNYAGEQLASYDWPVNGYQSRWTEHTTQVKRSSIANNVFIISSDHTNTHGDIWCTWEHYPRLVGRDLGSLISVLSGQVITKGDAFGIYTNNNTVNGYVNFAGTLDNQNNTVSTEILDGWNYIAMTYDNTNLKLYLNGQEADTLAYSSALTTNDRDVLMGQFLVGAIDDVKIYDEARSAAEIQASYNSCTSECGLSCGNGIVDAGETCENCSLDVGDCPDPDDCGNDQIDIGEECEIGLPSSVQGTDITNQYSCVIPSSENQCIAINGWCGDGVLQVDKGEVCEAKVVVAAAGYDWQFKVNEPGSKYNFIKVNGTVIQHVPRSWAVTVFNENWDEESYAWFDVYHPTGNDPDINDLITALNNLPVDKNIVISTYDEPKSNAYDNNTFINRMVELGATESTLRNMDYRSAYILATNTTTGKIFERYSPRFAAPIYFSSSKALDSLGSNYDCITAWQDSASMCQWNVQECGNFTLDSGEACDFDQNGQAIFDGETCLTQGDYASGNLGCSAQCEIIIDACVPGTPASNVCLNTEISAEFDSLMDHSSFVGNVSFDKVLGKWCGGDTANDTCTTNNDCGGLTCDTVYESVNITTNLEDLPPNDSQYSKLYIYPLNQLNANQEYRATVSGGINGVRDMEGNILESDYIWPFYTGATQCVISRVEIEPASYQFNNTDDIVNFTVHAYDENNNLVAGDYNWSVQGDDQLVVLSSTTDQTVQVSASGVGNGELSLQASVYASEESQGSANVPVDIFMCNVPWNYSNEQYNFKTRYCRGQGVNHIYNSGFEIDDNSDNKPDVWEDNIYNENWADISLVPSDLSNGGNYAVELNNTQGGESTGSSTGIASGDIDVKDAVYTLSAQIKGEVNGQLAYFGLRFMDADGNGLGGNDGRHYPVLAHQAISDNWTLYSASVRPPELYPDTKKVRVIFILQGSDSNDKHKAWIDNVQFELGDTATTYEEANLLPNLTMSVANTTGNELFNILFLQSDYNIADAVGLRVFQNMSHIKPLTWYQDNVTNVGSPTSILVGDYSGLQEGRTTYVNAANDDSAGNVYTNMFVLSYTDNANANTQNIFSQMYNNWTFNSNINSYDATQRLIRDTHRMENMAQIAQQLDVYQQANGNYPDLQVGTYLVGTTVSVWDSWQSALGAQVGQLPVDPINQHTDCATGWDPITCWNSNQFDYACPLGSYVYRYDYSDGDYYIYSNFEYEGVSWQGNQDLYIEQSPACDNIMLNNGTIYSNTFGGS